MRFSAPPVTRLKMRKSGRLASIHDDDPAVDNQPSTATATATKKFTPTIPSVRRKKVVNEAEESNTSDAVTAVEPVKTNSRKPLNTRSSSNMHTAVVSGPLSLGPAAMTKSTSSRSHSSSGSTSTIHALSRMNLASSHDSNPLNDSVPVEEEFAVEHFEADQLIKPVALTEKHNQNTPRGDFESGKLFLFQMPPILPSLTGHTSSPCSWPQSAQGRYGKLRRYKSGRLVLVLENGAEFCVNPSIDAEPQNTSVLAIDPEFAQSFNLGPIEAKFVCTPDFANFQKL